MSDIAQRSSTSPFAPTEPGRRPSGVPAEAAQIALPRIAVLGGMTLGLTALRRVAGVAAATKVARFVNLGLVSLLAGNGIGALLAIHPALRELPAREFLEAEQGVTRRYARIMSVLMPAAVVSCINVLRLTRDRRSPAFGLTVAGTANLIGMMVVTGIELPLNRKTLETSPDDVSDWVASRERWDRFNLIRDALTVNGWALLCLAALFERKD
ncbi:MAG TPA: DUF1772 domain-containing protein [Chloroflexota bacterium]